MVDWDGFNDGVRAALLRLANEMNVFGSSNVNGLLPVYFCPECQGKSRETTDMQCQTCGRDYREATSGK